MLSSIESVYGGQSALGAMSAVMGRSREEREAERAEAVAKGRTVSDDKQLETQIRGVAEDFVSVFMNQVMKSMRATIQENPAMHGDNGEKFFQEMLDTEQSKTMAKGSGYGLTELVYQSLMQKARANGGAAESEAEQEEAMPVAL